MFPSMDTPWTFCRRNQQNFRAQQLQRREVSLPPNAPLSKRRLSRRQSPLSPWGLSPPQLPPCHALCCCFLHLLQGCSSTRSWFSRAWAEPTSGAPLALAMAEAHKSHRQRFTAERRERRRGGQQQGWASKARQSRGRDEHQGSVARLQHLTILHQARSATWLQCQHTKRPTSCSIKTDHKPHVLSDLSGHIAKTLKLPEPCDKEQNLTLIILSGTAVCLHAVFEKKVWLMQCLARQTLDLS